MTRWSMAWKIHADGGRHCSQFVQLSVALIIVLLSTSSAYHLHPSSLLKRMPVGGNPCPDPEKPFPCKSSTTCIPMAYVCDQNEDCEDAFDEDIDVCTAVKRPPVEDILAFLQSENWIVSNIFEGIDLNQAAHGLAVSHSIQDLRSRIGMTDEQEEKLRMMVTVVQDGRQDMLEELGMPRSSWKDVAYMFGKLIASGFSA